MIFTNLKHWLNIKYFFLTLMSRKISHINNSYLLLSIKFEKGIVSEYTYIHIICLLIIYLFLTSILYTILNVGNINVLNVLYSSLLF